MKQGRYDLAFPILIADDDHVMAKLLTALFGRLGRKIHHAVDGDEAVAMARRLHPALIVLDLNMPGRGGAEVVRLLRSETETRDLPILVLSAQGQPDTEDRIRAAGADDFLPKPVDTQVLLARARALLSGARAG